MQSTRLIANIKEDLTLKFEHRHEKLQDPAERKKISGWMAKAWMARLGVAPTDERN